MSKTHTHHWQAWGSDIDANGMATRPMILARCLNPGCPERQRQFTRAAWNEHNAAVIRSRMQGKLPHEHIWHDD